MLIFAVRRASLKNPPVCAFVKLTKSVVVYKRIDNKKGWPLIAKLRIPKGTVVYTGKNKDWDWRKMRCECAKVLSITCDHEHRSYVDGPGDSRFQKPGPRKEGRSVYNDCFVYRVGKTVKATLDPRYETCASGIHFFRTRKEALAY